MLNLENCTSLTWWECIPSNSLAARSPTWLKVPFSMGRTLSISIKYSQFHATASSKTFFKAIIHIEYQHRYFSPPTMKLQSIAVILVISFLQTFCNCRCMWLWTLPSLRYHYSIRWVRSPWGDESSSSFPRESYSKNQCQGSRSPWGVDLGMGLWHVL